MAIARNFSRAAPTYDHAAVVQQEVGRRLMARLEFIVNKPECILDLGGGTGYFSGLLAKRYPQATILHLDLAYGMLTYAKRSQPCSPQILSLCGDGEYLPFASDSLDFIFCNCMLQWVQNLKGIFSEIKRVLKPNGLFLFATFGPDTLQELKQSFLYMDELPHINHFIDMHHLGDALLKLGFCKVIVDRENITLTYPTLKTLIQDLRATGANYVFHREPLGLSKKGTFQKLAAHYEPFRNQDHLLPATFEVIFGHALNEESPSCKRNSSPTHNLIHIPLSTINKP